MSANLTDQSFGFALELLCIGLLKTAGVELYVMGTCVPDAGIKGSDK